MDLKKITSLLDIAGLGINIPDKIKIEAVDVLKLVYMQEDTLFPVFVYYANTLSNNIYGRDIINISLKKSSNSLCFAIMEDKEDKSGDNVDSDSVKILFLMESIHQILGLQLKKQPNMSMLVKNWRRVLEQVPEGQEIKTNYEIEKLIINHLPALDNKQDQENRLGG
jgi:hypothetical protein